MRSIKYLPVSASLLLAAAGAPAFAQAQSGPYVQMESTSVNVIVGGSSGEGLLHLPNLGTNCSYPFTVSGFGAGVQVGVSKISASGAVRNMTKVSDLGGEYSAVSGEATVVAGAGLTQMKNKRDNVVIDLQAETVGLQLGVGASGMTISINDPYVNAPRTYVMEFGFQKTWVNAEARAALDQIIQTWKCRYASFLVTGHTDTVGSQAETRELAAKRADAVRDYLVGAGIVPSRITTRSAGENEPMVFTSDETRLRANRVVVLKVYEQQ